MLIDTCGMTATPIFLRRYSAFEGNLNFTADPPREASGYIPSRVRDALRRPSRLSSAPRTALRAEPNAGRVHRRAPAHRAGVRRPTTRVGRVLCLPDAVGHRAAFGPYDRIR